MFLPQHEILIRLRKSTAFLPCLLLFVCSTFSAHAQDLENIRKEKWLKANGQIGAQANFYNMQGIAPRRVPFQWTLYGNVNLTIKGVSLPFSFQYSSQQREFRQPFNQFGLSPTYKWFKMHIGWRNMYFSNYTLNNHLFLGLGVEANPGKIRLGAMYGRFLKAVQEDSASQIQNQASQFPYAAYNRWGYSVKIGYGTAKTFFDLIYFKAKDDIHSVKKNPVVQTTAPQENAVLGYKMRISFLKYFAFESDAAFSAMTRDLRADTFEAAEEYSKYTKLVMKPHLSTQAYYAGDAALLYKKNFFGATLKFQRIMPDYRSLGSYYTQTDVQRITLAPTWQAKNGVLSLSGSIGTEHDNLAKKKLAKTNRTIGSAMVGLRPKPHYGVTAQYSNYGISQKPGLKSISDTVILNQVNQSIIATPYYSIIREKSSHTLTYSFVKQILTDKNKVNSQNFSMNVTSHNASYSFAVNRTNLRGDISVFTVKTHVSTGDAVSKGVSLGLGKPFFKKKFTTFLNNSVSSNSFQGKSDGFTIQTRWNNQYSFNKKNMMSIAFTYINNQSKSNPATRTFQEYLATIQFNHLF